MKVEQINNITIDSGAPAPKVIASDTELFLIFYSISGNNSDVPVPRDSIKDTGVTVVRFESILSHKFGLPNDETLLGHPLYRKGLQFYSAQYIKESPWLTELIKINSVHPYHKPERYKDYKHFIFTFHDNTFECIAKNYQVQYKTMAMYDVVISVLQESFLKEF